MACVDAAERNCRNEAITKRQQRRLFTNMGAVSTHNAISVRLGGLEGASETSNEPLKAEKA